MILHPVPYLLSLSREYDVFASSPEPDTDLLALDLYPPLPVAGSRLVWGFRILEAALRCGRGELACIEVSGTAAELIELSLKLEGRTDEYSWDEKAAILNLMKTGGCLDAGDGINSLVVSSGSFLPQAEKYLELPLDLRSMVFHGKLDLKAASGLSGLPAGVIKLFASSDLHLSHSERRIVMQMVLEIMKRDCLPAERTEELVSSVLASADPAETARRLRMPGYTELTDAFGRLRDECLGGSGVRLDPPPMFEGSTFGVTFGFANSRQLAVRISALEKLQERCDGFFGLLR